MPRLRAQSAAVRPLWLRTVGSAPLASSTRAISHRERLVVRQPAERRDALGPRLPGEIRLGGQHLAQPVEVSPEREHEDVPAVAAQEVARRQVVGRRGEADRRGAPVLLARVDLGAPLHEQLRHRQRVVRRRHVQRALPLCVLELDRRAEIEQQRDRVGTVRASPRRRAPSASRGTQGAPRAARRLPHGRARGTRRRRPPRLRARAARARHRGRSSSSAIAPRPRCSASS